VIETGGISVAVGTVVVAAVAIAVGSGVVVGIEAEAEIDRIAGETTVPAPIHVPVLVKTDGNVKFVTKTAKLLEDSIGCCGRQRRLTVAAMDWHSRLKFWHTE
jgi:hypothetical protein